MNFSDVYLETSGLCRAKRIRASHGCLRIKTKQIFDTYKRKKSVQVKPINISTKEIKANFETDRFMAYKEKLDKALSDFSQNFTDIKENLNDSKLVDFQLSLCIKTLKILSRIITPLKSTLEKITENLKSFKKMIETSLDSSTSPSILNSKLKSLSEENVFLHKSCEDLKNEIIFLKDQKVFDEFHYSVEKLQNELSFKNQCISKYAQEINDLKLREVHLLKIIGKKDLLRKKTLANGKETLKDQIENSESFKKYSVHIPRLPLFI
jgi:hypothetical protein